MNKQIKFLQTKCKIKHVYRIDSGNMEEKRGGDREFDINKVVFRIIKYKI